jgi:DNA-binding SARP family transcriptional activator/TolB-like protein
VIELSFLGTPVLRRAGEASDAVLVQPRRLALLAYLAASKGAFQRRDRLLLLFWGDQPEARARASLRQALYFIRRSLGDDVFVTRGDAEVGLNPEVVTVDVTELERAIAEGRIDAAMSLYVGDFLADFNIADAPEFERWASERRRELRRAAVGAAWQLADAAAESASHPAAIRWARRALDLADHAETDVRRAMRTLASAGDRSSALEVYEHFRVRLAADLEVAPQPETSALADELRTSDDSRLRAGPISAESVSDVRVPPPATSSPQSDSQLRRPTRSRARLGAALAFIACAAALAGAVALSRWRAAATGDSAAANRVAVFPFTLRSRTAQGGYLREGAATLLGLALDGAGKLRIVDPNAVLSASPPTTDLDAGRRIAHTLGAGQFVIGEIEEAGSRLSIAATLYDGSGRIQARASSTGDESHLFDLVDTLARHLAVSAMTDSTVRLATVAATSTRSLAAFKSFLAGEAAMRAGHYRDAVAALQAAVAFDSTFGLAYYRLSLAREWTDGEISSDSAAALAEHFAAHLPVRDRKLLAARRAFVRRDGVEGERLASEVLDSYPTDADAWLQLGEMKFHLGPNVGRGIDDARAPFLTVLRYRPNDLSARVHLTRIAARSADSTHLEEWSGRETWLGDASEVGTFELAAMRAVVLGDVRARDTVAAAARRANDGTTLAAIWRLLIYAGDPDAAFAIASLRRVDRHAARPEWILDDVARGHIAPAQVADRSIALQHASLVGLMLALPSAPALPALARRAHSQLEQVVSGAPTASAAAFVATRILEARYPEIAPAHIDTPALTDGESKTLAAIVAGLRTPAAEPAHALELVAPEHLDEPTLLRDRLYDVVASIRAEALHRLGRDAEAVAWLSSIGMNSAGSSAAIALATRRRAELEEAMGSREAATRDRQRFVKMWQSSDPELRPLVEAARTGR